MFAAPRRLRWTFERSDRKLGRVTANTPLDAAALMSLDLLHATLHLVEILRPVLHGTLLPDFEADLHIVST